jgi:TENA/THI-4/PQQC family
MTDGLLPLDQGLFGRLRRDAGAAWDDYVGHDFVRALGRGTLPEAAFRHFLIQDYLFLIHFARAHALAGFKATQLADIRAAAAAVSTIVDVEMPLHVAYCAGWGLSEEQMAGAPEAIETMPIRGSCWSEAWREICSICRWHSPPASLARARAASGCWPIPRRGVTAIRMASGSLPIRARAIAARCAMRSRCSTGLASHLARWHAIRGSSPPSSRRRDWRRRSGTWAGGPGRCRVILETRTHPHPEADVALNNGD